MIEKYLLAKYEDGGRGNNNAYDCWGMTREARHLLHGRQLMASRGGYSRHSSESLADAYSAQSQDMVEVLIPRPGAVIAVLKKGVVCTHVALVVEDVNKTGLGLHVLEINPDRGARIIPLFRFLEENTLKTIKYYDDKSLSEQA